MDRDSPSCTHTDPEETCQGVRSRAADPDLPVSLAPPLGPDSQHWGRKTAHFTSSGHRSPSTSHAPRQDCVWGQAMNLFFNCRDFCWPFYQLDKVYSSMPTCMCALSYPTLLQSHGQGPARLLSSWNFPGKNTGVGYHFLLNANTLHDLSPK